MDWKTKEFYQQVVIFLHRCGKDHPKHDSAQQIDCEVISDSFFKSNLNWLVRSPKSQYKISFLTKMTNSIFDTFKGLILAIA